MKPDQFYCLPKLRKMEYTGIWKRICIDLENNKTKFCIPEVRKELKYIGLGKYFK